MGGIKGYTIAVRALCEFTAKTGDLDLRFTPTPTAQEGIAGHAVVASRRGDGYEKEVSLSGEYGPLRVRGRADGYDPAANQLEEVKTYRGDLARMPANHRALHWAQLKVYGHLLCTARGLPHVRLALVYFDIGSQKETLVTEQAQAGELQAFYEQQCRAFIAWAEQEIAHRTARDAALRAMRFPHKDFRPGQRQLAEAMYKASTRGCGLLAQAPTGIGKTVGSLFPLLKATAEHGLDKIFFLAAKTSGRAMALDAAATLTGVERTAPAKNIPIIPLRTLELVARDKACEHPDKACHGESCPLAQGFYDRLPAARAAALQVSMLDRDAVRATALAHDVCPYYLASELARWADVIVGDYNYYFDISAMLYSLTVQNSWKASVLVDEAHNMVSRTRKMYSAELEHAQLRMLRKTAPELLKKVLDRVHRQWNALEKEQQACAEPAYQVYQDLPEKLTGALQTAITAIGEFYAEHPAHVDNDLQHFYFDAMAFMRLAESHGDHSLFDVALDGSGTRANSILCLRNIVPAPFLQSRFEAAHTTALFSATLSPWNYYCDMLGMPAGTAWVDVESPFMADQLAVHIAGRISTRYQHRDRSLAPIGQLMGEQYARQPGNYLAFFSSFDYMDKAARAFAERYPDIPVWLQERRMDEAAREGFIARFTEEGCGIGFAVLGGAFGEGVDLPGARLIGAFIATLGLPQLNPVNEQIRRRMETIFGAGYDYTYLYPGMQKVVQAAGRVIRTETDKGTVYLIDDRFARPEVRALLPSWWHVDVST
ncbi:helicase C-terminal domain-containing protein [Pseudoduganella ginsengisoli]|uniref:ATP-dependent DNA helicase n=1 Tax=Pseudoduganella ginsengisoli TaxID=1462440 RepID=A0A6L6Q5G2_9BURK|nr:ATP-dependent DNA helicase [Pseudoduganella ginsengisoli]MTW04521.1 ATP-dependent DNA helicase [Pseudoduganella ginsengisoli]